MLTHLQLRDFVIVEAAELDFVGGLTALTGETGAGKSVVVDALSMLAGGRTTADIVRHGAERAEASASFTNLPPEALAWLAEQSIEHEGEVLVRRIVGADGRSRAYLNGQLLPVQALREFAEFMIEIHGQQEFQHLVRRDAQRRMLDEHAGAQALLTRVADLHGRYRSSLEQLMALQTAAETRDARLDLLRYQLMELRAEVTTPPEIEELFVERKRIAGRGRLGGAAQAALAAIYEADGTSANDLLGKAQAALRNTAEADPALLEAGRMLADAAIQVGEAADILRHFLDALDMDPARQEEIERRAAALEALARKHRMTVQELPEQLAAVERELQLLENSAESVADLENHLNALAAEYRAAAALLSAARRRAAESLSAEITTLMQALGMRGGRFDVEVLTQESEIGAHGSDDIEFLVSANPGQAPKSLAKVASGGELSRISLAVQVAGANQTAVPSMVFDEVDAGIGGAIAEIVGLQLRALGERGQVLCVTHLAQVASQAHVQYRVTKLTDGRATRTTLQQLRPDERIDEIARMLGGIDITEQARAHAREMLGKNAPREPVAPKRKRGRG
jgi:DNA repair protein RecN (Recombination protein N)